MSSTPRMPMCTPAIHTTISKKGRNPQLTTNQHSIPSFIFVSRCLAPTTWAHNNATHENKPWPGTQPALRTIFKCLLGQPLLVHLGGGYLGLCVILDAIIVPGLFQGSQLGLIGTRSWLYRYWWCVERFGDWGVCGDVAGGDDGSDSGDWGVGIMGNVP